MRKGEGSSHTDISTAPPGRLVHGTQLLVLAGLIVLTIVALWPVQQVIGKRLALLKAETIKQLELATNRQFTYDSISPSIFHSIEIRGLRIYDENAAHSLLLSIRQVQIYYNIFKLFGADPISALSEISIENTSLAIDTETDRDLVSFLKGLMANAQRKTVFPSQLRLSGRNLTLSIRGPSGQLEVDRLFFQVQNGSQGLSVQVRGAVNAGIANRPMGLSELSTVVSVSGLVGRDLKWSDLRLRFDKLSSNLVTIVRPTFHVSLRDGVWQVRKVQDKAPLDLQFSYDEARQLLRLSFVADHFRPSYYFAFGPKLEAYTPWLSSVVSGTGSLTYSVPDKRLTYESDTSLRVANRYLPSPLSVVARLKGDLESAQVSLLSVTSSLGDGSFSGAVDLRRMIPSGSLTLANVVTPLGGRLSATLSLLATQGGLVATSSDLEIGSVAFRPFSLTATPEKSGVDFHLSASFPEGASDNVLVADGSYRSVPERYLQISLSANRLPLTALYAALQQEPSKTVSRELSGLNITTTAFVASDLKHFSFISPQSTISSDTAPNRRVTFGLVGNERNLQIRGVKIDWGPYHGAGAAGVTLIEQGRVSFNTDLTIQGVSYRASGYYVEGDSLVASGNHGFDLAAIRQGDRYVFRLLTKELPLPFRAGTAKLTLDLEGFYSDPTTWEVLSRRSVVSDLPILPVKDNQVALSARISADGGDIYSLTFRDAISSVTGTGRISLRRGDSGYRGNGWIQLYNPDGTERYEASINFNGPEMDTIVSFTGAPLTRFGQLPLSGDLTGSVALTGDILHPAITANLTLPEGQLFSDPVSGSVTLTVDSRQISLLQANFRYLTHALSGGSGTVELATGKFSFTGGYQGEMSGDLVDARVSLSGQTVPLDSGLSFSQLLAQNFQAKIGVSAIRINGKPAEAWSLGLSRKEGKLTFAGGPSNAVAGYLLDSGAFSVSLSDPLPLALQATGTVTGSTIDASLQNVVLDLHAFDAVAKIPYFDISKGKARGDLTIDGPINDPEFQGDLHATSVYGKAVVIPDEIGPFNTDLAFRGKTLAMTDVTLPSGTSQVLASLDFTLDHWVPTAFNLQFRTETPQGVHVKYPIAGLDFDGYASGTIVIQGDSLSTELSGNLVIDSCVITIGHAPPQPPSGQPTEDNTTYDFTFTTGKRVEFVWPSLNVPILRGYADTAQKLHINADGSTGDFSIVGNIDVKSGEIYYFRQSFYLQTGSISFNEDQDKVDPILNARAEIREVDQNGRNVSVYLVVNDQPLSQFSPRFESDPPMSSSDILTLLGQNIYPQLSGQQTGLGSAVSFTGDILSQFSIMRAVEQKVRDLFGLDLFSVRTQILQNIISEKIFGAGPTFPNGSAASLGQYLDNTTLFLGKYLTNDLFLEAMISLRSNNAFLSAYGGATNNLLIDSELLLEWKTPLFLLQLSLLPDPTDLVPSQLTPSLSLSWGFSF